MGTEPDRLFHVQVGTYQFTFSRNVFLAKYPDSLIGLALQDKESDTIEITQKCVTPLVISIVYRIINSVITDLTLLKSILQDKQTCSNINEASRYLLMPELMLWSDLNVIDMINKFGPILIDRLNSNYLEMMKWSIDHDYHVFIDYAMRYGSSHSLYDKLLFVYCIIRDKFYPWSQFIEKKRVDVKSCIIRYADIKAIYNEMYPMLYDAIGQSILQLLQRYGRKDMIQYLEINKL